MGTNSSKIENYLVSKYQINVNHKDDRTSILYPLKRPGNQRFSDVFWGYRNGRCPNVLTVDI